MKAFLLIFLAAAVANAAPQSFNILFVLSDDHSAPHMGCYGDPNVVTPHFDCFATEAVRFKRAYTTAPQCAPSRKSILSGRSPVGLQQTLFTLPLQADVVLFPELLKKEKGYQIGLAGRSHHLDGDSNDPLTSEIHKTHNLKTTAKRFDSCKIALGKKNCNEVGTNALIQYREFLDSVPDGKPFFLQLCFSDPHRGWDDDFHPRRHDPAKLKLPTHFPDLPAVRMDLAEYYDEVARMDHYFGLVLEELEKRGLASNTLVLFIGDNGSALLRGKGTPSAEHLVPGLVEMAPICKPGVLRFLAGITTGTIELQNGFLAVRAPDTRVAAGIFYDTILAGRARETLLTVANDLLDVLQNASREAPIRGLTLENTFNPSHMIGGLVGAAVGFFLGFFIGFLLLFLVGRKFFHLIPVLAVGGAALGNWIGKRLMRPK